MEFLLFFAAFFISLWWVFAQMFRNFTDNSSLIDLYSKKSLSEGMYLIANAIKEDNLCCLDQDTYESYKDEIDSWMEENSYLYKESLAIHSKRTGNYDYALIIYNSLLELNFGFLRRTTTLSRH